RYLLENREFSADEIIKKRIDEINYLLKDIDISTKILDIDDNKLVFENAQGKRLEISDLSDGEKQIYYRAIFLNSIQLKNSLIFVDEPELSLHPRWQMIVSKLYQNAGKNNQVFLATHSPHIISSINPDSLFILHYSDNQLKSNNVGGKENYTRGLEPNRILNEIMGTPLRPFAIQEKIEYVNQFLDVDFNTHKMHNVIKELIGLLGRADPFIIRLNHQLLLLNRKKSKK
ncbi:MAG: ATP-binding protein, partial [Bacteroidales bacterium]|nr:ATP-binding protein [Bacteroidales bacterium]